MQTRDRNEGEKNRIHVPVKKLFTKVIQAKLELIILHLSQLLTRSNEEVPRHVVSKSMIDAVGYIQGGCVGCKKHFLLAWSENIALKNRSS